MPDAVLADLKARLAAPRLIRALNGEGWQLGTDVAYLRELVTYWRDRFDWRAQERRLNAMEQFTTTIDGLQRPLRPPAVDARPARCRCSSPTAGRDRSPSSPRSSARSPIRPAHGGAAADAFHVVMPSIPGFGFSEAPRDARLRPGAHRANSRRR